MALAPSKVMVEVTLRPLDRALIVAPWTLNTTFVQLLRSAAEKILPSGKWCLSPFQTTRPASVCPNGRNSPDLRNISYASFILRILNVTIVMPLQRATSGANQISGTDSRPYHIKGRLCSRIRCLKLSHAALEGVSGDFACLPGISKAFVLCSVNPRLC